MDKAKREVKTYEPPTVEMLEVTVEKGFASSVGVGGISIGGWGSGDSWDGEADE